MMASNADWKHVLAQSDVSSRLSGLQLQPARLLELAVASTKSSSLAPVVGAVVRGPRAGVLLGNAVGEPVSCRMDG